MQDQRYRRRRGRETKKPRQLASSPLRVIRRARAFDGLERTVRRVHITSQVALLRIGRYSIKRQRERVGKKRRKGTLLYNTIDRVSYLIAVLRARLARRESAAQAFICITSNRSHQKQAPQDRI